MQRDPGKGAPNRCCHATTPTGSKSPSTTIAWWPMRVCSCRPPSPSTWADHHLDLGSGAVQHQRQDDDAGGLRTGWRRLHRRRRCVGTGGRPARWAARSRRHPPWAPLSNGPEPGVAGPGLGAGAGPGNAPFTIDLDSTVCETYGLAKEGARHHGYTGKRGYHPLLAIAAGTGDVLMSRLREGRAHRSGRRPLPAGDGEPGSPCRSPGATHGAGRQRLLHS